MLDTNDPAGANVVPQGLLYVICPKSPAGKRISEKGKGEVADFEDGDGKSRLVFAVASCRLAEKAVLCAGAVIGRAGTRGDDLFVFGELEAANPKS